MKVQNTSTINEASRRYAAAHALHYGGQDLRQAVELYLSILSEHPGEREAEYARVQIHNIARSVVPAQELLDAVVERLFAHLGKHLD